MTNECFSYYSNKNHYLSITLIKVLLLLKPNHMQESGCASQSSLSNSCLVCLLSDNHAPHNIAVNSLTTKGDFFLQTVMFPLKKPMAKQMCSKYCKDTDYLNWCIQKPEMFVSIKKNINWTNSVSREVSGWFHCPDKATIHIEMQLLSQLVYCCAVQICFWLVNNWGHRLQKWKLLWITILLMRCYFMI